MGIRHLMTGMFLSALWLASATGFATDATDVGKMSDTNANLMSNQTLIADDMGARGNMQPGRARSLVIKHNKGTFIPAANRVLSEATTTGYTNLTSDQKKTVEFMDNMFGTSVATGGLTPGVVKNVGAYEADVRTLTGEYVAAGTNVGLITAKENIRQVDMRVNWLQDQNRASVDKFGSSSDAYAAAVYNMNFANRIWVTPFYTRQEMDRKDDYAAYDYDAWGVSAGYDHVFGPITVGGAFTYSRGDYDEHGVNDDNTIDNYGFSLYATYYACNGFFADITGGYNYGDNDMKRWVANAGTPGWQNSDNHTSTYWIGGKLGFDFRATSNFTLTPTVGLYWLEARGSAHTANGAAGAQHFSKIKNKAFLLPVDLTARYRVDLGCDNSLTLRVTGGYAYNFKNDGAEGDMRYGFNSSLPVSINGVKPGRSSWNVGAGVTYQYKRFDFSVDYRYDSQSKYDGHRVSGTIGINF